VPHSEGSGFGSRMPGLEWLLRKEVKRSNVARHTSPEEGEEGTLSLQASKALPRASPLAQLRFQLSLGPRRLRNGCGAFSLHILAQLLTVYPLLALIHQCPGSMEFSEVRTPRLPKCPNQEAAMHRRACPYRHLAPGAVLPRKQRPQPRRILVCLLAVALPPHRAP
jgi:hypothetical protein